MSNVNIENLKTNDEMQESLIKEAKIKENYFKNYLPDLYKLRLLERNMKLKNDSLEKYLDAKMYKDYLNVRVDYYKMRMNPIFNNINLF